MTARYILSPRLSRKKLSSDPQAFQTYLIKALAPKKEATGLVISGGDPTPNNGPTEAPRKFVYKIQKKDGSYMK